jgi:hypothetical protein
MLHTNLALFKSEVVGQQSISNRNDIQQSQQQTQHVENNQGAQGGQDSQKPKKPIIRIEPSINASTKKRVMLCGTYPIGQSNGYSRVVYYISKFIGLKAAEDIQLTIYGFQNFKQTASTRNDIPPNVILHDAMATEEPKRGGFGEKEIGFYLKEIKLFS